MSDVRAAAERLLKFEKDCNFYGWPTRFDRDVFMEALAFVSVYLAEHPADENEPLTEEFVVSLNPPRYWEAGCEYAWPDVGLRYAVQIGDGRPPGLSAGFYLDAASGPVYLRHIKTRGEARELLKAMGVSHG